MLHVLVHSKTAYSKLVQQLACNGIFHVDKTDFLANYQQAQGAIHSKQNILSGFCATELLPFNPSHVLSTLTITKTPSPPTSSHGQFSSPWVSETPKNTTQITKQMQLVQIAQSPTEPMAKVAKSASIAWSIASTENFR